MRLLIAAAFAAALSGCAMSPQSMAGESNFVVCRFTMGGPHSQVAQQEAQRRALDCAPLYGAIAAQNQAQNAATNNLVNALNPPAQVVPAQPRSCRSYRVGNDIRTDCR